MTGYCARCHTIVDVDTLGYLASHGRRSLPGEAPLYCPGTHHTPWPTPDTPEVAAAAFSEERRPAKCPRCDNPDAVGTDDGERLYMRGHAQPGAPEGSMPCPGSWMQPTYALEV